MKSKSNTFDANTEQNYIVANHVFMNRRKNSIERNAHNIYVKLWLNITGRRVFTRRRHSCHAVEARYLSIEMCKHKYTLTIRSDADYVCTSHDGSKVEKEFRNDWNDVFESYESTRSRPAMMTTTTTTAMKKKKKKATRMRCEWIVISIYLFSFPFLRLRRLHRHRHRLLLWIQCFWIDHFVYAARPAISRYFDTVTVCARIDSNSKFN